jgi:FkbM family methyltransferase
MFKLKFLKIIKFILDEEKRNYIFRYFWQITLLKFYTTIDALNAKKSKRLLIFDLGSNVGQGFKFLYKNFNMKNSYFELFEPNPNCKKHLLNIPQIKKNLGKKIFIKDLGVYGGARNKKLKFYGLDKNLKNYPTHDGSFIENMNGNHPKKKIPYIKVINFSDYLSKKLNYYKKNEVKILVKMDIEGSEIFLLKDMIKRKTINLINILYVEFHNFNKNSEKEINYIKNYIKKNTTVKLRPWF